MTWLINISIGVGLIGVLLGIFVTIMHFSDTALDWWYDNVVRFWNDLTREPRQ